MWEDECGRMCVVVSGFDLVCGMVICGRMWCERICVRVFCRMVLCGRL